MWRVANVVETFRLRVRARETSDEADSFPTM